MRRESLLKAPQCLMSLKAAQQHLTQLIHYFSHERKDRVTRNDGFVSTFSLKRDRRVSLADIYTFLKNQTS
jgi:hypothetical protein